jgi:hypothetical protein
MTFRLFGLTAIVPVIALLGAATFHSDSARKCGRPIGPGEPLFAVDGVIRGPATDASMSTVDKGDLYSVEVLCLNAKDSTFVRGEGIPLISVWTKSGPVSHLKPVLAAILEAQDGHFRKSSTYIAALDGIKLPARSDRVRVTLQLEDGGWIATSTVDRLMMKCRVFDGHTPPRSGRREITCVDD